MLVTVSRARARESLKIHIKFEVNYTLSGLGIDCNFSIDLRGDDLARVCTKNRHLNEDNWLVN